MEATPQFYDKAEYIETLTGNKVSRKSSLCGSQNIRLHGKTIIMPDAMIRGDLAAINVGKYSVIGKRAVVRPSCKRIKGTMAYFPVNIGESVFIDEDCVVSAASIGSYVHIGKGAVVSKLCILKDCCWIEEGSVLAPGTVVPPFTVFGGSPAVFKQKLPDCFQELQKNASLANYTQFTPQPDSST